jgi:hypothetical protein
MTVRSVADGFASGSKARALSGSGTKCEFVAAQQIVRLLGYC